MKLEVQTIWSPDLNPPSEGVPDDPENFDLLMQVSLGEVGKPGGEVFGFSATSVKALSNIEPNRFLCHILVLERFDWKAIRNRIDKFLMQARSCNDWNEVIIRLSGCLKYCD